MRTGIYTAALAVASLAIVPPPAAAQASGDEKCSPDGYVMTYYATLKSWRKSLVNRCDAAGSSGSTRDFDDDDDRGDRRSSRTSGRRGDGGGGRPEDGDRKCVAGQLLEFKRYDALPALTGWKPSGLC